MKTVRLWDIVTFDEGQAWQVVAIDATHATLKSQEHTEIRQVAVSELFGDDTYDSAGSEVLPSLERVADLDRLDVVDRDYVMFLQRHVHEVLTGLLPDSPPEVHPRRAYAPSTAQGKRVRAKIEELDEIGITMSERTLLRHLSAYRRDGVAGLIDGRRMRVGTLTGRVDPRVVAIVERVMAQQTNMSTGTRGRVLTLTTLEAHKEDLALPSRATMYRLIKNLDRNRHTFGNATSRRTQSNSPDRAFGRQAPTRPGELVEIDSTPLDLQVLYPDGATGRVDLTIAIDIATRTICSAILRPIATKSVDAAILLARAMTPLPMQPGWDNGMALSRSILPAGMIIEDTELHESIAARPLITPESVTIDRGTVFVSNAFRGACERLGISITKAAPRSPTDKPHVERAFAAINSGLTQYLSGYTGQNVVRRGKDPAADAVWPLAQVQDVLDQWLVSVWQNRPHDGLRHIGMPRMRLSPNEMYKAMSTVAPTVNVVLTRDDYIAMLPRTWRTVQRYGINLENLAYDCEALRPFRGVGSGIKSREASDRWEIRYDPYRMNKIFLRDHRAGKWVDVPWTLGGMTVAPFSLDVLKAAVKALEDRGVRQVPGIKILEHINRIAAGLADTTEKERKTARRNAAATPNVPDLSLIASEQEQSDSELEPEPARPPSHKIMRVTYDE